MRATAVLTLVLASIVSVSETGQAQVIGDKDCFGTLFGSQTATSCNGQTYDLPAVGTSGRSAAEIAATNGAEQTDLYSSVFSPVSGSFTMVWNFTQPLSSAAIMFRAYGLQSNEFGPLISTLNGVAFNGLLDFQDGFNVVATHAYGLSADQLNRVNADGFLSLTISRSVSNDAVAFDYFEVESSTATVPEPSSIGLLAAGLAGLVGVARRRRSLK